MLEHMEIIDMDPEEWLDIFHHTVAAWIDFPNRQQVGIPVDPDWAVWYLLRKRNTLGQVDQ